MIYSSIDVSIINDGDETAFEKLFFIEADNELDLINSIASHISKSFEAMVTVQNIYCILQNRSGFFKSNRPGIEFKVDVTEYEEWVDDC